MVSRLRSQLFSTVFPIPYEKFTMKNLLFIKIYISSCLLLYSLCVYNNKGFCDKIIILNNNKGFCHINLCYVTVHVHFRGKIVGSERVDGTGSSLVMGLRCKTDYENGVRLDKFI